MKEIWKKALAVLLCAAFVFAGVTILATKLRYRREDEARKEAADRFTSIVAPTAPTEITAAPTPHQTPPATAKMGVEMGPEATDLPQAPDKTETPEPSPTPKPRTAKGSAPIQVDFQALQAVNPQVVGWLYCPDTPIHYAVCHGTDDDFYLDHGYDGRYRTGGTIFVEAANRPGLVDANMILYGHHMRDGSMFGSIENWQEQAFYDTHPCMYFLTPEGDYRLDLVSGRTVSATGEAYTVYYAHGADFTAYLNALLAESDFVPAVEADPEAQYLLLSTCDYSFELARYVLLGMLTPLEGGEG